MAVLRSLAVVAVALAIAQVSSAHYDCGCAPTPYVCGGAISAASGAYGSYLPSPGPAYVEGCCAGQVVEQDTIVNKAVEVPYSYSVPTYSKKCYNTQTVDRKVIPSSTVSQKCNGEITTIKVPTKDTVTEQQPLCKRTCTTSEYTITIPIVETTCTSTPLCKKTVKAQDNVLTTVAKKTSCAKQTCTTSNVVERPVYQTVCQDYQGAINKVGSTTVIKPEIQKSCVQLPPYKCLKPAGYSGYSGYGGAYAVDTGSYSGYAGDSCGSVVYGSAPAVYEAPAAYEAPAVYEAPAAYCGAPAVYSGYGSAGCGCAC